VHYPLYMELPGWQRDSWCEYEDRNAAEQAKRYPDLGPKTREAWFCTKCNAIVSLDGPQDIPYHRKYNHCFAPVERRDISA